jgi:hypothetical protein
MLPAKDFDLFCMLPDELHHSNLHIPLVGKAGVVHELFQKLIM